MSFNEARRKLIECLKTGYVLHEERNDINVKNLLAIGVGDGNSYSASASQRRRFRNVA